MHTTLCQFASIFHHSTPYTPHCSVWRSPLFDRHVYNNARSNFPKNNFRTCSGIFLEQFSGRAHHPDLTLPSCFSLSPSLSFLLLFLNWNIMVLIKSHSNLSFFNSRKGFDFLFGTCSNISKYTFKTVSVCVVSVLLVIFYDHRGGRVRRAFPGKHFLLTCDLQKQYPTATSHYWFKWFY